MRYDFLINTYETERLKVISASVRFTDDDLLVRASAVDPRGRSKGRAIQGTRTKNGRR